MRKITASLILLLAGLALMGQTSPRANHFYKQAEDWVNDKPIDGVVLTKWKDFSSTVEYSENGTSQKVKASKMTYTWFANSTGKLMRVYEGDLYYTMAVGPICFYIKASDGAVSEYWTISGKFSDSWPNEYYSLTPTGPIEKLKESVLEEYLEKYGLKKQYDTDPNFKREMKDCVLCWQEKKTNKMIKYVKLLNEKMK